MLDLAIWIQILSSMGMVTLILLVQVLIYPQFKNVSLDQLPSYASFHSRRISYIVVPLMILEAVSLGGLVYQIGWNSWAVNSSGILLLLIWGLTFFKIVPVHKKLSSKPESRDVDQLLKLNSVRTFLWATKAPISIHFCMKLLN